MTSPPLPPVVLVVEGDELVLRACAEMLSADRVRVRAALHGAAALRALADGEVHVVVANVQLPDLAGPELLRAIRERDADLPVIFVTRWPSFELATATTAASGDAGDRAESLRAMVVSAAIGYRMGQRARRRTRSPSSPSKGE